VLFRLGRVAGWPGGRVAEWPGGRVRRPGLRGIVLVADRLRRVSLRLVTMPIQSQGNITRDNISVDVSEVAYFRVIDATKSVVVIEN
jgi:regulator of protease activity HflC (stomatin/prohibitin superfamily)